jgi:uncharacterized tellurite resistance protein B-like protein
MVLRRFLGLGDERSSGPGQPAPAQPAPDARADTATIRRIVSALEALPEEERRYVAGFAYVLGRAAHADLLVSDEERSLMERTVRDVGRLPEAEAVLVAEIARSQNELYGATEDYLVTRHFKEHSTLDQRLDLLRCAFEIGAVEGNISAEESAELNQIAKELDVSDEQLNAIRGEFHERFEAIQRMRRVTGERAER